MPLDAFTNTYAGSPLDRASARRGDEDWLQARLADPASAAVVMWKGSPLLKPGDESRLARLPIDFAGEIADPEQNLLFMGVQPDETAMFAVNLDAAADPAAGPLRGLGAFRGLREATPLLSGEDAAIAATARAVFEWRRLHRFCARCGQPTRVVDAGWRRQCPACSAEHFPRTDPVVIMLPVCGERCLLGRQASWDPGRYSALAGYMEPGESIEEACAREVSEEAKLEVLRVAYHSSQPWPYPSTLMIGLIAQVADGEARPDQTELEAARWFRRAEARALLAGQLDGFSAPPRFAIAHTLLKAWSEG